MSTNPWRVPAYLPYLQPALTPAAIAEAEATLGVKLPAAYLACLRLQNGGYIRFDLPGSTVPHEKIWGIGPHFPNISDYHQALDANAAEEDGCWAPRDCDRLVPFDGDGHWFLCLDYRGGSEPAVACIDVEAESDHQVAATFDDYLKLLVPSTGGAFLGVRSVSSIDEVAQRLQLFTRTDFEPASDWAHGYPVRRCQLASAGDSEWIWVSPNLTARGFARPTDHRSSETKDVLPGEALRLPEYPEALVLISCTEGLQTRLAEWCRNDGMDVVVLGSERV